MKVWGVLIEDRWEPRYSNLIAVFSSEEKAIEYVESFPKENGQYTVGLHYCVREADGVELDYPPTKDELENEQGYNTNY